MRLRAAWGMADHEEAKQALKSVRTYLAAMNEDAARSLDEGFDETLTIQRIGVPEKLRKSLATTNAIESCFSGVRDRCKNVKRWRDVAMIRRWAGTALLDVEKNFRRIRGYREMPALMAALNSLDQESAAA